MNSTADSPVSSTRERLQYSVLASANSTRSVEHRECTWPELVALLKNPPPRPSKAACSLLKLATFGDKRNAKGSLRHDGNVAQIFGVEGDYDDGEVTPAAAARRLRGAGVRALIYTTPSHTASSPRWRVLAPLSAADEPSKRANYLSLLNGALGGVLAPESWVLSQTYYFGQVAGVPYEVHEVEGDPLDVVAFAGNFAPIEAAGRVTEAKEIAKPRSMRDIDDPVVGFLESEWEVTGYAADGLLHVRCPWEAEHTRQTVASSTTYLPAGVGGEALAGFKCLHSHCSSRNVFDFLRAVGYDDPAAEFDIVQLTHAEQAAHAAIETARAPRFVPIPAHEFAAGAAPAWIVKGVLPQAELAVLFGESGSGKSFLALDLVAAVARGIEWRGCRVRQGPVVYVAAEGSGNFRKRLTAYSKHHGVDLANMSLSVIADAPNLLQDDDKALAAAILSAGGAAVIVIDTLAQVTPGGNENSGEDMGKVLARCKRLHGATGALIVLVHHSGKDASKGARGWSGVRAAVDAEIEVNRTGDARFARISKMKDGEDSATFAFHLLSLAVGIDDDGDAVTSCVVEHTEFAVAGPKPQGKWQVLVARALDHLVALTGDGGAEDKLLAAAVALEPYSPEDGKRDRRREMARRALIELESAGFARIENGLVRLPLDPLDTTQPH